MFRGRILNRYIRGELIAPFFLSMAVLTLALLLQKMFRLAELVVSKSASPAATAKLVLYILPGFLMVTVPISLLVAGLTAFSRLSSDAEITAMKASRISLYSMIRPVMGFSFLLFLMTASIAHFLAPNANYALKVHLFEMVKAKSLVGLEEGVFSSTFDSIVIYVDRMRSLDDLSGIFISDARPGNEPYVITAKRGRLIANPEALNVNLAMEHGSVHLQPRESQERSYSIMTFTSGNLNLDINQALLRRSGSAGRDIEATDTLDLVEKLRKARSEGQPTKGIEMEIHKRFSVSFACLIFGLIGAPLGIRRSRSGRSAGIALSIVVILVYYLILATGTNLAESGALSPAAAYWVPNGIITLVTGALVVKKGKEIHFGVFSRLGSLLGRMVPFRKKAA